MEPLENDAAPARPGTAAELLGYLAVAPLLAALAGVALLPAYAGRELAQRSAIAWGAVLLAFTAAVHWGLALAAAAAVILGGQRALALLVVGFGIFWLYEHRSLGAALPPAYLTLRRNLSLATCTLLALIMIASDAAGLL